jgi:UDP-glucose:(heptosyl)LPS alpha-1,3-glucosyltransferase
MPLRLAFAVAQYRQFGGMQRTMLRVVRECMARGHEVEVFTTEWEGEVPGDLRVEVARSWTVTNHGRNRAFARWLARRVRPRGHDALVGFTKMPGLDVYYAGDPCLAARLDATRPYWFRWRPRYRSFLRLEAWVFAPGRETRILLIAPQEKARFMRWAARG